MVKDNLNFRCGDLHVHTPISTCYKGPKDDDEYIRLLRKHHDKKVNFIAITDHNTIAGYQKILEIGKNIRNKAAYLKELLSKYPNLESEYLQICSDQDIFDNMFIIPGVELEVKPNIHLLLLFDPSCDLAKINDFLTEVGYTPELRGQEVCEQSPKLDVLDALERASLLNAIVIAAHADDTKGILKLNAGDYRADIFKSKYLHGISYNNIHSKKIIEDLLNQREYKRQSPIAFVQSSDYHGATDCATRVTYFNMKSLSFEDFKCAILNPDTSVSPTAHPDTINQLNEIIQRNNAFGIAKVPVEIEDKRSALELICGILNEGYGVIIFGAKKDKTNIFSGLAQRDEEAFIEFEQYVKSSIQEQFNWTIKRLEHGNKWLNVVSLRKTSDNIYSVNNSEVFLLKKSKPTKATIAEIRELGTLDYFNKMAKYNEINDARYSRVISELDFLKDSYRQLQLFYKIEKSSFLLSDILEFKIVPPYTGDDFDAIYSNTNGSSKGNLYFIRHSKLHLDEAYLRATCPSIEYEETITPENGFMEITRDVIVIAPGGGSHFIPYEENKHIICLANNPCVLFWISEKFNNLFSLKSILAWLKSATFGWYNYATTDNLDIYIPSVFKHSPIPTLDLFKPTERVDECIDEIILQERQYLELCSKMPNNIDDEEFRTKIDDATNYHNTYISKLAMDIECLITNALQLNEYEIDMIKKPYALLEIYCILNPINFEARINEDCDMDLNTGLLLKGDGLEEI